MRTEPTWRIPIGLLSLLLALLAYGLVVSRYAPEIIGTWPGTAQAVVYLVLGLIWLIPLKRFLRWMETGRWR